MLFSARSDAIMLTLALLAAGGVMSPRGASAQQAAETGQGCVGILCGLIDGNLANRPAGSDQAAPRGGLLGTLFSNDAASRQGSPGNAPGSAAPALAPQGGLVGVLTGAPPERCVGILCGVIEGNRQPTQPSAGQPEAIAPEAAAAAAVPEAAGEPPEPPPIERRKPPRCATVNERDPWACYR